MADDLCSPTVAHQLPSTFLNEDIFAPCSILRSSCNHHFSQFEGKHLQVKKPMESARIFCFLKKKISTLLSHIKHGNSHQKKKKKLSNRQQAFLISSSKVSFLATFLEHSFLFCLDLTWSLNNFTLLLSHKPAMENRLRAQVMPQKMYMFQGPSGHQ